MDAEKVINTNIPIQSKDIIARMASDIEAKYSNSNANMGDVGNFWEKLTPEQQEQLRDFILNPPQDTPSITGNATSIAPTTTSPQDASLQAASPQAAQPQATPLQDKPPIMTNDLATAPTTNLII